MNRIWTLINTRNWRAVSKTVAFMWILGLIFGIIGLGTWGIVQMWVLDSITWMLVFAWYPGFAAALVGFFYCCNNEFANGAKVREVGNNDRVQEDETLQARIIRRKIDRDNEKCFVGSLGGSGR